LSYSSGSTSGGNGPTGPALAFAIRRPYRHRRRRQLDVVVMPPLKTDAQLCEMNALTAAKLCA
jgi:hypothetical protein